MRDETLWNNKVVAINESEAAQEPMGKPIHRRALDWTMYVWRPAVSVVAVGLALLLGWHVVQGKNGLSAWEQKRVEDRELRKEIDALNVENALLRKRVDRLQSNPDAIGQVAREELHYAKPNEVIIALPPDEQKQTDGAVK